MSQKRSYQNFAAADEMTYDLNSKVKLGYWKTRGMAAGIRYQM
jgi:hypothetical protein